MMLRTATFTLLFCICGAGLAIAQEETAKAPRQDDAQQSQAETKSPDATGESQEQLSDAERVLQLQRTIAENEKLLAEHKAKLEDPEGEYPKAEAEVNALDKELEAKQEELQKLKDEGKADEAATLQSEVEALQQRRELAKERFDLAFQERKTLQEQIATLEQRIKQDQEALDKLLAPPATQPAAAPEQAPTTTPAQPPPDQPPVETTPPQPPGVSPPGAALTEAAQEQPDEAAEAAEPPSEELEEAEKELEAKKSELEEAQEAVQSLAERIAGVETQIEQEKTGLETARRKVENARETERTLGEQYQKLSSEGAPAAELQELWKDIADARQRIREAQEEEDAHQERIAVLQRQLNDLQAEQIAALEAERASRQAKEEAEDKVGELKNPFSPRNLLQWVLSHGPRIVGILVAMMVLLWLARVAEHRIVKLIAGRGGPGTQADRENRAKTLVSVLHHAATWIIAIAAIFMILDEVGVPIGPLMGGAAVVGLAVAFGAQNLVRDYFSGFMLLLENQYRINDVIKIAGVAGLVERVTLRVTVLRDLEGIVHFVPNGQIDKVSNMTHGWSRALFAIGVAYKEDVDQVMQVLVDLGKQMRTDPQFRDLILDDPEMLGLDSFDDSAVVIKFFIKTRPLKQWTVKRAMLGRIKKKFDELGIEIPFPHRTVFHRYEEGTPPTPPVEAGARPA